jgi:hypothetical protein
MRRILQRDGRVPVHVPQPAAVRRRPGGWSIFGPCAVRQAWPFRTERVRVLGSDFVWDPSRLTVDGTLRVSATTCDASTGGDIDRNGRADFADFVILSGNYGQAVAISPAVVPVRDPSAWGAGGNQPVVPATRHETSRSLTGPRSLGAPSQHELRATSLRSGPPEGAWRRCRGGRPTRAVRRTARNRVERKGVEPSTSALRIHHVGEQGDA